MAEVSAARWPRLRQVVRWTRIALLLLALLLVCGFVHLNLAGLPEPFQRALRAELAARGLDFECESLRLNWNWAILAEGVRARAAASGGVPELTLEELEVRINWREALRGRIAVASVIFREGRVTADLAPTNEPPDLVAVENLGGTLRFPPGDQWELDSFRGQFLGASFSAFGSITNASQFPRLFTARAGTPRDIADSPGPDGSAAARAVVREWRQVRFVAPPEVRARFGGDAANPDSFTAEVRVTAPGVVSKWGNCRGLDLALVWNEPRTDGSGVLRATLKAEELQTPWADADAPEIEARLALAASATAPRWLELKGRARAVAAADFRLQHATLSVRTEPWAEVPPQGKTRFEVRGGQLGGRGFAMAGGILSGDFTHDFPSWRPVAGGGELILKLPVTPYGRAESARVMVTFERDATDASAPIGGLPPWLPSWRGHVTAEAENLETRGVPIRSFHTEAVWASPQLTLINTAVEFADTSLAVESLTANARTRDVAVRASARGRMLATLQPGLPESLNRQLTEVTIEDPLSLQCDARARLPHTVTPATLESAEFRHSLSGRLALRTGRVGWRDLAVDSGELTARCGDQQVSIESLVLRRAGGALSAAARLDLRSLGFSGQFESRLSPQAVVRLSDTERPKLLQVFEFRTPPSLSAEFAGRGLDAASFGASGSVACADLAVRGQDLQRLSARVLFTNFFVSASEIEVFHGHERAAADGLGFDVRTQRLWLTNATSDMPPMLVATAIGTNVVKAIKEYRFLTPPKALVNGSLITKGRTNHADLRFDLTGGPFEYWRFRVPQLQGSVLWQEETVTVTNLLADFYGGQLGLDLRADLLPGGRVRIGFDARFANADLRRGMADLVPGTTNLDGTVSGRLTVRELFTDDWKSWEGAGEASLRDGYLWDLPLMAFLSGAVNSILPGVGKARASAGTCSFTMTNSVLSTRDLKVEARPLRLAGKGTVDFDANVNMDFEAEILPGIPLVGPLFNLAILPVSKAFTYRVTGTLGNPRVQPLYVPKFLSTLLNLGRQPNAPPSAPPEVPSP